MNFLKIRKKAASIVALPAMCCLIFVNYVSIWASESQTETNVSASYKKVLSNTLMSTYDESIPKQNSFFGLMSRLRYLNRWAVLQNHEREDLEHHSFEVAMLAYSLATIKNKMFEGTLNAERAAVLGLFHDVQEIITGDVPSPIKHSDIRMKEMYNIIEEQATEEMLELLPDELKSEYRNILVPTSEEDKELKVIVKSADIISAIIKCYREKKLKNHDFDRALEDLTNRILKVNAPEVQYFLKTFMPAFGFIYPGETSDSI